MLEAGIILLFLIYCLTPHKQYRNGPVARKVELSLIVVGLVIIAVCWMCF